MFRHPYVARLSLVVPVYSHICGGTEGFRDLPRVRRTCQKTDDSDSLSHILFTQSLWRLEPVLPTKKNSQVTHVLQWDNLFSHTLSISNICFPGVMVINSLALCSYPFYSISDMGSLYLNTNCDGELTTTQGTAFHEWTPLIFIIVLLC